MRDRQGSIARKAASHLVGIAGGSCSGKTTVAGRVAERLGAHDTARVTLDSYYRNLSDRRPMAVARHNFDEPEALDVALLLEHVRVLASGGAIERPVYDLKTHARLEAAERIEARPFVIIEGIFALYWQELRGYLGTKVFIEASHDVCLARRVERDVRERARTPAEVKDRYDRNVRPMFDLHVLPTKRYADVLIDGTAPVDASVDAILRHIDARRRAER